MHTVTSKDGTSIAVDRAGQGPAVVLVDGALCTRAQGPMPDLVPLLADHFTVYTYDRRGRGDSGDTAPYAVEREIEDLEAVIEEAGGHAHVYGISSGGALALEAASHGLRIDKLALYEVPYVVDDTRPPTPADLVAQISDAVAAGRRAKAVKLFMRDGVRVPGAIVALMGLMPAWPKLKAVAHTLPYDLAFVIDRQQGHPLPATRWSSVAAQTLVVAGGKSPAWMRNAMDALASVVPGAKHHTLDGQTHLVKPKALAPVLIDHFAD
ncbi:MAG: alpha/beta fold hydrolase [Propionibacteriales bacterium]|nr:alpha/beta fold hydrolase [Propionibacteriales bacterium]